MRRPGGKHGPLHEIALENERLALIGQISITKMLLVHGKYVT